MDIEGCPTALAGNDIQNQSEKIKKKKKKKSVKNR